MRKAWAVTLVLAVLLTGASGCGKYIPEEPLHPAGNSDTPSTVESNFNFIFKYGVTGRNTLDTLKSTFTKDMVMDPAITVKLSLSGEEMDSIYQKMVEIDFFNYPDKFSVSVPPGELKTEVTPYSTYFFRVTYGTKSKELLWHDKITNSDEKADKLKELITLIRNIIESKEEYKKLPEPRSGYL